MKIKPEHLQVLSDALDKAREQFPERTLEYYISNKLGKDHAMRWRWDLFHLAIRFAPESFTRGGVGGQLILYSYMNDTHIDTALRHLLM